MERYYGKYIPVRNVDINNTESPMIYDYRIEDYKNDPYNQLFSKLVTFNLAIILAQKLRIEYFKGKLADGQEKYFKLNNLENPLERFRLNEVDQDLASNSTYLEIKEDDEKKSDNTRIKKPFIKIFNHAIIENTFKISLDFVDSGFTGSSGFAFNSIKGFSQENHMSSKLTQTTYLLTKFTKSDTTQSVYFYSQDREEDPVHGTKYKTYLKKIINETVIPDLDDSVYFICCIIDEKNKDKNWCVSLNEGEFKSLLFSCLPTPLISDAEITKGKNNLTADNKLYHDISGRWALAIDPSVESKDKDDAIYFEETTDTYIMYVYISDVSPYMNPDNDYIFDYARFKQETEYISHDRRYPLLDPFLSETSLSLMTPSQEAIEIKVVYKKNGKNGVEKTPESVTVRRVKNLKVVFTTYSNIHDAFVNVNFNDTVLLSTYPSKSVLPNNFTMKPKEIIDSDENAFKNFGNLDSSSREEKEKLYEQIKLIHKCYKEIGLSVDTMDRVLPYLKTFEIKISSELTVSLEDNKIYDSWIHALIEVTALEANKYIALIEYNYFDRIMALSTAENRFSEYTISKAQIEETINKYVYDETKKGFYRGTKPNKLDNPPPEIKYPVKVGEQNKYLSEYVSDSYTGTDNEMITSMFQFPVVAEYVLCPKLHFSINSVFYTHFTSPLRRFCDLAVHNLLFRMDNKNSINKLNYDFEIAYKFRNKGNNKLIEAFNSNINFERFLHYLKTNTQPSSSSRLVYFYSKDDYNYCQFFVLNSNISFYKKSKFNPFSSQDPPQNGFYYLNDINFVGKNSINFKLTKSLKYSYDKKIRDNIQSFLTVSGLDSNATNNYLTSIIDFSFTSNVKHFIDYFEQSVAGLMMKDHFINLNSGKKLVYSLNVNNKPYTVTHIDNTTDKKSYQFYSTKTEAISNLDSLIPYTYLVYDVTSKSHVRPDTINSFSVRPPYDYKKEGFIAPDKSSVPGYTINTLILANGEKIPLYLSFESNRNLYVKAYNQDKSSAKDNLGNDIYINYTNVNFQSFTGVYELTRDTEIYYTSINFSTIHYHNPPYIERQIFTKVISQFFTKVEDQFITFYNRDGEKFKLNIQSNELTIVGKNGTVKNIKLIGNLLCSNLPTIIKYLKLTDSTNNKYLTYNSNENIKSSYQTKYLKYKAKYIELKEKLSK